MILKLFAFTHDSIFIYFLIKNVVLLENKKGTLKSRCPDKLKILYKLHNYELLQI